MSVELNHRVSGHGEPLIVLHGLFGSLDNLGIIARQLEDSWQIHALDLRNHGSSPHTDDMDYPSMASDVVAYMDSQGIDRASILGHSMGGKVALQVALSFPERVSAIIAADIAPVTYHPRHDNELEGMKTLDLAGVKSRREAEQQLSEYVPEPGVRQFLLKNLERIPKDQQTGDGHLFRWRLNLPVLGGCYNNLAAAPEGDGPFEGPVLFIKGADSAYIQDKHRDAIKRLFPAAELEVLEDTSHWLHAQKPEAFAALCRQFLEASCP
ncbi:alpha/beta fold hydrolase [Marinobacter oulmenensis]|uniref:Esterase n=1 Tax=Marinobacter oulmenensis TaxID=643747 RepID=A0A840UC78_9GAMM|nr:alpha/beta fold hydrolase [Marinobacter oulmenensis]MBB5320860.1 esterase [Marinobacter oulmenensis]